MEEPKDLTQSGQEELELAGSPPASGRGRRFHALPHGGGKKRGWLFLAVIVIAVPTVFLLTRGQKRASAADAAYTEAEAAYRSITQSLTGSGTLEPANSYSVTTLIQGEILSAGFEEGDTVEEGDMLFQIDSSDASTNIEKAEISLSQAQRSYENAVEKAYVKAPVSGAVYSLEVNVGDEVQQGQTIATVRNSSTMTLVVPFPADDAANFYVGQPADVTLDGSFETLTGTVKSISGSDIVSTGNSIVRNVTISVSNPGGLGSTQAATAVIGGVGCASSGTFSYQADSTVTAAVSGTVAAVNVREGGSVSKNQTIVTLGGDDLEDQIQSARENLRSAELSMENTQDQLDNYTVTSPIAGTIIDKIYNAGESVESGNTLCTIYDLSYLEMTLNIDELDISSVEVGQKVSITADAVEGKNYEGVITKVSVAGTTSGGTTTYPVTIRIDETDGLRPGMNVDAEIVLQKADNALAIPSAALNRGDTVLITADSPSAENALDQEAPEGYVYVQVETGVSDDSYLQITSGLQEGDTVAYTPSAGGASTNPMMEGGMVMGGDVTISGGGMPSGVAPSGGPGGGGGGGFPG